MVPFNILITNLITDIETNPQDLILFFTLIITASIGVTSILFTAFTLRAQWKHNRLSVRPIPNMHFDNRPTKTVIRLENNGVGPLIIKSLNLFFRDDENKLVCKKWPEFFSVKREHVKKLLIINLGDDRAMKDGDSIAIFECSIDPAIKEQRIELNTYRSELKRISHYELEFTDIYGTIETKKMSVQYRGLKEYDPNNEKIFIGPFSEDDL